MRWFGLSRRRQAALRPARMDDARAIAELHSLSFSHPWPTLTVESLLADRTVRAHVADNGRIVGFLLLRVAADEAEVLSIGVAPSARARGLGRRLMEAGLDGLVFDRIRLVFLEVETENLGALKLYQRLGFELIGRRKGYYRGSDGISRDALTMRLDISSRSPATPLLDG
ncbi:MAG TPA: ribosomal protein S18-alanine N-acetyltransferase [Beijerinckiaceae bacterium]|nr:ribosomal protein S18-alanine N-acetyltransferase [Beijerinckiaceae bacterium]